MRLRSDLFVAVLLRRAQAAGAYVVVARKGAEESGAIHVVVARGSGVFDLYGPAPQSSFMDDPTERSAERLFSRVLEGADGVVLAARLASETRFDPDLWVVEIEDREGRPFVELARE